MTAECVAGRRIFTQVARRTTVLLAVRNEFKEVLWRLAVDGVVGAHKDLQGWMTRECGCSSGHFADMRMHCFWSCPVAQAVLVEMSRLLGVDVQRQHVWLLQRPEEVGPFHCPWHVWAAACMQVTSHDVCHLSKCSAKANVPQNKQSSTQNSSASAESSRPSSPKSAVASLTRSRPSRSTGVAATTPSKGCYWL